MSFESYILYEDNDIIVIHKPSGLQVENDKFNHPSVENLCYMYLQSRGIKHPYVGIVHRIDRPTSGVLILAKKLPILKKLNKQIEEKKWKKIYHAEVEGILKIEKQKLIHWIEKNTLQKKAIVYDEKKEQTQKAELDYIILNSKVNTTHVSIKLHTGRYHQIRAQFSHIGHPIVGDTTYCSTIKLEHKIHLHSYSIEFFHPTTNESMNIHCNSNFMKL